MADFMIFSGLCNATSPQFQTNVGIGLWCFYNDVDGVYQDFPEMMFQINTPNYADNSSLTGGALDLNGQKCGTAPIQYAGVNNQMQGPAMNISNVGGNFPTGKGAYALGAVDMDVYEGEYPDNPLSTSNWATKFNSVGYRGDGSNTTNSKSPGMVIKDPDTYNVIVGANTDLGVQSQNTGGRVHWDVGVGNLGQFVSKILGIKIGEVGGSAGGVILSSTPDELAAGCMLLAGYGILLNGSLAFATDPNAP